MQTFSLELVWDKFSLKHERDLHNASCIWNINNCTLFKTHTVSIHVGVVHKVHEITKLHLELPSESFSYFKMWKCWKYSRLDGKSDPYFDLLACYALSEHDFFSFLTARDERDAKLTPWNLKPLRLIYPRAKDPRGQSSRALRAVH